MLPVGWMLKIAVISSVTSLGSISYVLDLRVLQHTVQDILILNMICGKESLYPAGKNGSITDREELRRKCLHLYGCGI